MDVVCFTVQLLYTFYYSYCMQNSQFIPPETPGPKQRRHFFGFLDETGLLQSPTTDRFFGLGILVIPRTKPMHDELLKYRQRKNFYGEFKFTNVRRNNLSLYKGLVDIFFETVQARFCVVVHDKRFLIKRHVKNYAKIYNSFAGELIAEAVKMNDMATSSEYLTILADDVSTAIDDSFEKEMKEKVKSILRRNALFGVFRLESHAISEIQLTDVLLGTVAYAFKVREGLIQSGPANAKLDLVKYFQTRMGVRNLSTSFNNRIRKGVQVKVIEK